MKKLLIASCLLFGSAFMATAQENPSTSNSDEQTQYTRNMNTQEGDAEKVSISQSELPAIVQESLQSQDFVGWTVAEAYRKEKDGKTFYAVELRNGSETKMVKFDDQGNKVKEKDKDEK